MRVVSTHVDIISMLLAWQTISILIVTDGPCLLGNRVKKGENSTYMLLSVAMYIAT